MKFEECPEIEIRQHIPVEQQKGLSEMILNQAQRPDSTQRLRLFRVCNPHIPLLAVTTNRADEASEIPDGDANIHNAVPAQPLEQRLNDWQIANRH